MTTFWILAAAMVAVALLFVLPPLLRKPPAQAEAIDEDAVNIAVIRQQLAELEADLEAGNLSREQYESARRDLEKELLVDVDLNAVADAPEGEAARSGTWAAPVLGVALPLLALGLYLAVGDTSAITAPTGPMAAAHAGAPGRHLPPMDVLVERLAEKMAQHPDNLEGWLMLGRSYLTLKQPQKALAAMERAYGLAPKDTNVLLGYAETLVQVKGRFTPKARELVTKALEINPKAPNGLWMLGLAEFQAGDFKAAVEAWSRLRAQLRPGGEDAQALSQYIAKAREKAGMPPEAPQVAAAAAPRAGTAPAGAGAIQVEVTLADALMGQVSPDDSLFIYAKALQGPPMPLAVKRLRAKDLPVKVTLNDALAMMPQMRLSRFDRVKVGARISKSGRPIAQSGDLEGEVQPVRPGQKALVQVVIDRRHP